MARRLLVVSPAFHGIWHSVSDAFEQLGWEVTAHLYDDYATFGAKLRNKVEHEIPAKLGRDTVARRRRENGRAAAVAVRAACPDVVLTIKGDVLGEEYWDELDRARLPRATWLYDQLSAMHFNDEALRRVGGIATFSRTDSVQLAGSGLTSSHVHLAYDPAFAPTGRRDGGVVFAGARYPAREQLLLDLQSAGISIRTYGRSWSHHPFDRLRTLDLRRPDIPSGRELDRRSAHEVMEAADATVNIHGAQDGFTLRTFEAPGVGAVHLIDRPDVDDLYEPDREVLVYNGVEELKDLCLRAAVDRDWAEELRRRGRERTLAEHTFVHRAKAIEPLFAR